MRKCVMCGVERPVEEFYSSKYVCEHCEYGDNWKQARAIKNFKEFQELLGDFDQMTDDYAHRFECSELDVLTKALKILEKFEKELEKDVGKFECKG